MQKRHWQQPLVTGSQSKEILMSEANKGYTGKTNLVSVLCESQLPWFRNLPVSAPSKKPPARVVFSTEQKPPARVVFSFTEQEITRRKKGSQEDPFIFSTEPRSLSVQRRRMGATVPS
ncbi:hypothetical protein ACQFN5_00135 (plasmid) [Klebsiella sp. WOUb02]|uniref:hypothetical protein n=1 Tax=Klebsiella sp. WOUb02 TaxID=3161071 RepID=UPI003CE7D54F